VSEQDDFTQEGIDPYATEREAARILLDRVRKRRRASLVVRVLLAFAALLAILLLSAVLGVAVGIFIRALHLIL
jgi:anti-sigma factor RsiW